MNMSVCLWVRPRAYLRNGMSNLHQILHENVTDGRGSVLLWRRCDKLCISGFMGDVIFSHDGRWRDKAYTQSDSAGGSTNSTARRILELTHHGAAPDRAGDGISYIYDFSLFDWRLQFEQLAGSCPRSLASPMLFWQSQKSELFARSHIGRLNDYLHRHVTRYLLLPVCSMT